MKDANARAALFHNVRSAHNVGAFLRTADGAGTLKIYLTGYTPTPLDRFGRPQKEVAKTALGAENTVAWEYVKNPLSVIKELRKEDWMIVGVEQDARAVDYRTISLEQPTLFIFGNEVRGISRSLRDQCDQLLEIPMRGKKESLNVSVTAGVILFRFSN